MAVNIALAGNPNSGKTTLFNALTGSNQFVGNWPGVTVEKKEGKLKGTKEVMIVDLPGIYSLSPYTLEEVVARNYLLKDHPDAILNIVDGTNLERNLYLTTQLLELGIPVLVAINMADVMEKTGDQLNLVQLQKELNCPVVMISALKQTGIKEAAQQAVALANPSRIETSYGQFDERVEKTLERLAALLPQTIPAVQKRFYAIKLFERDRKILADLPEIPAAESIIASLESELEEDAESIITNERYLWISSMLERCYLRKKQSSLSVSDRIDLIVTNRWLALPIFIAVMALVYAVAMGNWSISIGTHGTEWTNDVFFGEIVPNAVDSLLNSLKVSSWLSGLIQDGIVAGVGAVLGFVPQMLVLFLLLCILEDIGYMARIAFIMDRIFRRFGLSGKSFIPMLVATGCGVPGIMASRTVEQDRDRKMTIMTTGFIPCGAKMPIIGLFAGALFENAWWVATSAYFIGVAAVILSGIILKKFRIFAGDPAPFVMELPAYHIPSLQNVLRGTWERGWSFIKRAGTVILVSSIVLWFLQGYGFVDGVFQSVEDNNHSLLALIGNTFAWVFYPIGWVGDMAWKATVATFTGLIAKEEVVNTFGVLYHYAGELSETGEEIWSLVQADFSGLTAYSFMIFNLLCAPCFAAMGAIRREMNNAKWTIGAIGYMCGFAYGISLIVYQLGGLLLKEVQFNFFTIVAIILLGGLLFLLFRPYREGKTLEIRIKTAKRD